MALTFAHLEQEDDFKLRGSRELNHEEVKLLSDVQWKWGYKPHLLSQKSEMQKVDEIS